MKKLSLLLTSLLLAGTANAGFAEFTTDTSQVEEWQDFQVAHGCSPATHKHIPYEKGIHQGDHIAGWGALGQGGNDGRGHYTDDAVMCVSNRKINECARQNRVVKVHKVNGRTRADCGDVCPLGQMTGKGQDSDTCVSENCPEWTVWQPQHQKCTPVPELIAYCKSLNQQYNHATRGCFTCPTGSFPQESGCKTLGELNAYCASTNSAFVYGVAQDACVSVFDLRQYCREEFDKGYNKDTAECEVCPADHFPQESGCVSKANLDKYCEGEYRTSYNPKEDRCWLPRELY